MTLDLNDNIYFPYHKSLENPLQSTLVQYSGCPRGWIIFNLHRLTSPMLHQILKPPGAESRQSYDLHLHSLSSDFPSYHKYYPTFNKSHTLQHLSENLWEMLTQLHDCGLYELLIWTPLHHHHWPRRYLYHKFQESYPL